MKSATNPLPLSFIRRLALAALMIPLICIAPPAAAQDKDKKEKKEEKKPQPPAVIFAWPLAVSPGDSTTRLRGLRLDSAKSVRIENAPAGAEVKIKSKGKADLPDKQEPAKIGDTQLELELKLPADIKPGELGLIIESDAGASAVHRISIIPADKLVMEKEPNEGFKQSQPIEFGRQVQGMIRQSQDVDVYRFTGKSGGKIIARVLAAERGSALDAQLTLYDASGRILAWADDNPKNSDPAIEFTLPADGDYHLAIIDAHDRGGPAHVYLLNLELKP